MEYAMAQGASIINMSFVGTGNVGEAFREVLKTAAQKMSLWWQRRYDKTGNGVGS